MYRVIFIIMLFFSTFSLNATPYKVELSPSQIEQLGMLIWKNEGMQQVKHLTSWNRGEDFPSLGLGHFIWYTNDNKGPFKEQFPQLVEYMKARGVALPKWLEQAKFAPWNTREEFYDAINGPRLTELRTLLSQEVEIQASFIMLRLEKAIPLILEHSDTAEREIIMQQLSQFSSPEGIFTLLDYVNFKGEGIEIKEQYQGEGWGLKQVLLAMPRQSDNPLRSFGLAADEVLTRRVKNAPRDEFRWLKGWRARVHDYQNLSVK